MLLDLCCHQSKRRFGLLNLTVSLVGLFGTPCFLLFLQSAITAIVEVLKHVNRFSQSPLLEVKGEEDKASYQVHHRCKRLDVF